MNKKNILIWSLCYGGIFLLIVIFFLLWCLLSGTNPIDWLGSKWAMYMYLGLGAITVIYLSLTLNEISKR